METGFQQDNLTEWRYGHGVGDQFVANGVLTGWERKHRMFNDSTRCAHSEDFNRNLLSMKMASQFYKIFI